MKKEDERKRGKRDWNKRREYIKETKKRRRREGEGDRPKKKKSDGKAEDTHTLRPEVIFREGVTSLGLPKAHLAPGKPKVCASGRGGGVCVREQMDFATQGVCTNLGRITRKKGKRNGGGGREIFRRVRLSGWLGIQPWDLIYLQVCK